MHTRRRKLLLKPEDRRHRSSLSDLERSHTPNILYCALESLEIGTTKRGEPPARRVRDGDLELVRGSEVCKCLHAKLFEGVDDFGQILSMVRAISLLVDRLHTWSGTMRMEMSAVTFFGMTVLFAEPDELIFAIEKLG